MPICIDELCSSLLLHRYSVFFLSLFCFGGNLFAGSLRGASFDDTFVWTSCLKTHNRCNLTVLLAFRNPSIFFFVLHLWMAKQEGLGVVVMLPEASPVWLVGLSTRTVSQRFIENCFQLNCIAQFGAGEVISSLKQEVLRPGTRGNCEDFSVPGKCSRRFN